MEQIEQLKHEKNQLMRKREEIKRLERISESPPPKRARRTRSRSADQKRRPIEKPVAKEQQDANHHEWTEAYARKSIQWDSADCVPEQEMLLSSERLRLEKYTRPIDVPTESSIGVRVKNKYTAYKTKVSKEPREEKSRSLRRNNASKKKKKQLTPSVHKTPNKYKRRQKSP